MDIYLWETETGDHKHTFEAAGRVISIAFSPDGNTIAGASYNGTLLLWDLTDIE